MTGVHTECTLIAIRLTLFAEAEIQKKKFEDIWRNANMLKHVAPIPVIAEAITNTPDALLSMIKMDPETFRMPTLNSVAQMWLDSTFSTVISYESKKNDDDDDDDDDDPEDDTRKKGKSKATSAKKKKGGKTQKDSNNKDNADDEDDEGRAGHNEHTLHTLHGFWLNLKHTVYTIHTSSTLEHSSKKSVQCVH